MNANIERKSRRCQSKAMKPIWYTCEFVRGWGLLMTSDMSFPRSFFWYSGQSVLIDRSSSETNWLLSFSIDFLDIHPNARYASILSFLVNKRDCAFLLELRKVRSSRMLRVKINRWLITRDILLSLSLSIMYLSFSPMSIGGVLNRHLPFEYSRLRNLRARSCSENVSSHFALLERLLLFRFVLDHQWGFSQYNRSSKPRERKKSIEFYDLDKKC